MNSTGLNFLNMLSPDAGAPASASNEPAGGSLGDVLFPSIELPTEAPSWKPGDWLAGALPDMDADLSADDADAAVGNPIAWVSLVLPIGGQPGGTPQGPDRALAPPTLALATPAGGAATLDPAASNAASSGLGSSPGPALPAALNAARLANPATDPGAVDPEAGAAKLTELKTNELKATELMAAELKAVDSRAIDSRAVDPRGLLAAGLSKPANPIAATSPPPASSSASGPELPTLAEAAARLPAATASPRVDRGAEAMVLQLGQSARALPGASTGTQSDDSFASRLISSLGGQSDASSAAHHLERHANDIPAPPRLDLGGAPSTQRPQLLADAVWAQFNWMADRSINRATIELHPEDLGQIDIELQLDGKSLRVEFVASQAETRQLLESALPKLRELFANNGLQMTGADVHDGRTGHGSGHSPGPSQRAADQFKPGDKNDNREQLQANVAIRRTHQGSLSEYA